MRFSTWLNSLLRKVTQINPEEKRATLLSFFLIFSLMCAYYILRPVRDALASDWSDAEVSLLWTLNFAASTLGVGVYGWAISRLPIQWIAAAVYSFFALTFLFFTGAGAFWEKDPDWLTKGFYVWVSIFSLFNVSVFWSFMTDLFRKEQATRLFAIIGSGASAGALIGPAVPSLFISFLGTDGLLIAASSLLLLSLPLITLLNRLKVTQLGNKGLETDQSHQKLGKNPLDGFRDFISNRYLVGIGIFIMFYTTVATIAYFLQKNLLVDFNREERSQILAVIDWIVNILTFSIAFFATSRLVQYGGMPFSLSSVPFTLALFFFCLAFIPLLGLLLAFQVIRRAGNYAISRPAREMLFTQVSREERFQAKPVIDVVCYRGGDMVSSWVYAFLTQGLGFGLTAMALFGAFVALFWGGIAIFLGRRFERF